MENIGKRAAFVIRQRVVQNRSKLYIELNNADIDYNNFHGWEIGKYHPSGYQLRKLALAGFDVMWILLEDGYGER